MYFLHLRQKIVWMWRWEILVSRLKCRLLINISTHFVVRRLTQHQNCFRWVVYFKIRKFFVGKSVFLHIISLYEYIFFYRMIIILDHPLIFGRWEFFYISWWRVQCHSRVQPLQLWKNLFLMVGLSYQFISQMIVWTWLKVFLKERPAGGLP